MKVVIAGSKEADNYVELVDAIKKSGFKITELVSCGGKGIDQLAEKWAIENNKPIKKFIPEWSNLKAKGAEVKVNNWGKEYNVNAAKDRDEKVLEYVDGLISIGPSYLLTAAKERNIDTFEYNIRDEKTDDDYLYIFGSDLCVEY